MVRAAALAVCLLALAAGAAALVCTDGGVVRLEYVGIGPGAFTPAGEDAKTFLKCLTSFNLTFNANCDVTVTPILGNGLIPGMWTGSPTPPYKHWVECPTEGVPMPALGTAEATADAALEAFPYGHVSGVANRAIVIDGLDFQNNLIYTVPDPDQTNGEGLVTFTITTTGPTGDTLDQLIFAITHVYQETDSITGNLVNGDDINYGGGVAEPLTVANDVALNSYELGFMYRGTDNIQDPCDNHAIGTLVGATPSLSGTTLVGDLYKICHWCPAGTHGTGFGCTTCPAGTYSGWNTGCEPCPPGTYSNAGSSECIPCPTGTYAPEERAAECLECPEDSYAWIPGSRYCLRCINGVPEECSENSSPAGAECPSGTPVDGVSKSSPGTHIITVDPLTNCNLHSSNAALDAALGGFPEFEIFAATKCSSWASGTGVDFSGAGRRTPATLQLALTVGGDCSILVSPISDESCADPTDPQNDPANDDPSVTPAPWLYDENLPTYGQLQWRMYYQTTTTIRSLFDTNSTGDTAVKNSLMSAIDAKDPPADPLDPWKVTLTFYGATTDALTSTNEDFFSKNGADIDVAANICSNDGVAWGSIAGTKRTDFPVADVDSLRNWPCPAGTYYDVDTVCPVCPVGHICPGLTPEEALVIPCPPNEYNPFLGLSQACEICPNDPMDLVNPEAPIPPLADSYTSYEGAAYCTVPRVDLICAIKDGAGDLTVGYQYDIAEQACVLCPPGTYRDRITIETVTTCQLCPAGYYSGEGAIGDTAEQACTACPAGQYNPLEGLPDQTNITGIPCIACAEGSVALSAVLGPTSAEDSIVNGTLVIAATFCDACPSGSYKPADVPDDPATVLDNEEVIYTCVVCPEGTYRAGDATPENNECKPVPAGYRVKAADVDNPAQSVIELCPKGEVSFYTQIGDATVRIPEGGDEDCISCVELDAAIEAAAVSLGAAVPPAKWAHTYAPRAGMTQCIPCPGGTVPKVEDVTGVTISCQACPNGQYRDAYTVSSTCTDCGAGMEVGSTSKMACTMCRAGYYNDRDLTAPEFSDPTTRSVDVNSCKACPQNEYRPTQGATTCLECPRGTQTANTGNVECTPCPIGYFNNEPGTNCTKAPAGTFVNTTGAYVTTPCPKGTWNNETANDNCNPCAPGKYSNTLGSKECKTCAAGTYSSGQSTGCSNCRAGYFAPAGAAACSPCKPGTYAPDIKSATCKLCPKGYQCPTNAMKTAGGCPRGTFSNKEGNKQCTPCPINTYSLGGGSPLKAVMACIKCAPGTNTRGLVGQSKCQVIRPQVKRLF